MEQHQGRETTRLRLITIEQVMVMTGLGKSHIYDLVARQLFPRPVRVGLRAVRLVGTRGDRVDAQPAPGHPGQPAIAAVRDGALRRRPGSLPQAMPLGLTFPQNFGGCSSR